MATPGTFVAVLGGGQWHEIFLLQPSLPGGCDWICTTTDGRNYMTHFYSGVRLVEGAVVCATDSGPARKYPGLQDSVINWIVKDITFDSWVPTQDDLTEFEGAIVAMRTWAPIPEQWYFCAGGQSEQFPDLAMVAAARQNGVALQPGCFAIIKRGEFWYEVFVCLITSNNNGWLCCTSSFNNEKVWTAIQFMPGSYLAAEVSGSKRMYPGVSNSRINFICDKAGNPWVPTSEEAMALLEEAKVRSAQLGTIPPEIYCVSGGSQDCVPSIEDMLHMLQNRVLPAPGRFVAIKLACVWQEALLCVAVGDMQWLCLCSTGGEEEQITSSYWTVQTLEEGKYFVLAGAGADRFDTAFPVSHVHTMCKVPENSMWLPTPQRIRKALADAKEVLGQVQGGKLILAEADDENMLQPLKAVDSQ